MARVMVMLVITTPLRIFHDVMYAGGGRGKFKSPSENDLKAVSH